MQALQHMGGVCPGLSGPESRQDIRPCTFLTLFSREQIVIPLFQRAYCWGAGSTKHFTSHADAGREVRLVEAWWKDVVKASVVRPHSVGRIVFTRDHGDSQADARPVLCIDGQQRCTTNFLLLAALRDAALHLLREDPEHSSGHQLVSILNRMLYVDPSAAEAWVASAASDGDVEGCLQALQDSGRANFMRLLPSCVDRKHYYECTLGGLLQEAQPSWAGPCELAKESHQGQAKLGFDRLAATALESRKSIEGKLTLLQHLAENALKGMQLMYVEVLNKINQAALFLWMQDSSLMNVMFNPHPGIHLRGVDMVRNFVLSSYMHLSLSEQEQHYSELWLEPLELQCSNVEQMEAVLERFVEVRTGLPLMQTETGSVGKPASERERRAPRLPPSVMERPAKQHGGAKRTRHVCATEAGIYGAANLFAAKLPKEVARLKGGMLYARFRSIAEDIEIRLRSAEMGAPMNTSAAPSNVPMRDVFGNIISDMVATSVPVADPEEEQRQRALARQAHGQLLQEMAVFMEQMASE